MRDGIRVLFEDGLVSVSKGVDPEQELQQVDVFGADGMLSLSVHGVEKTVEDRVCALRFAYVGEDDEEVVHVVEIPWLDLSRAVAMFAMGVGDEDCKD